MEEAYDIRQGDCREVMREMPENSVDAIVTDPPYGLSFMGKEWDHGVPGVQFWKEALRVAKPGAHLLAFGGTRTYHRLACAIEDAGWEIRDCVMWVYGSGFPKSHDVSKAIDKAAGAEREVVGFKKNTFGRKPGGGDGWDEAIEGEKASDHVFSITGPATNAARQWSGWGTALKPAWEPVIVARKPLIGTVAENVLTHGTGGINVDGCRVGTESTLTVRNGNSGAHGRYGKDDRVFTRENPPGRWPANVIHDGSDEVVGLFPQQASGANPTRRNVAKFKNAYGNFAGQEKCTAARESESGSAARFFYVPKASKADRNSGGVNSTHPTVKPTDLMRYLCRLVTPPGGVVLDPFTGSGSTGKAAMLEGFRFIGIDLNPEYIEIARGRLAQAAREATTLF